MVKLFVTFSACRYPVYFRWIRTARNWNLYV